MTELEDLKLRLEYIAEIMTDEFWILDKDEYVISAKYKDIKDVVREVTLIASMVEWVK